MTPPSSVPHGCWPAALNKKLAAAYCGLSVDTFHKVCPVRPIKFTESVWGDRYLRLRLDEWLLSIDPATATPKVSLGDYFGNSPDRKKPR